MDDSWLSGLVVYLGENRSLASAQEDISTRAGFLHVPSSPTRSSRKNFVWKKGPNNRYIKCPLDQLDEDKAMEEFSLEAGAQRSVQPQNSGITDMEAAMLEEAMKRSMRDLYAGY